MEGDLKTFGLFVFTNLVCQFVPAFRPEDACESVHQVTLDTQGGLRVSSLESPHVLARIVLWEWPEAKRSTYQREGLHVQLSINLD